MEYNEELKDTLEGDLLGSNVYYLCYISVFVLVASLIHFFTSNVSNAIADMILGVCTLYFVVKPSVIFIIPLMSYSMTLSCTTTLLLLVNIFKHPKFWLDSLKKRIDLLMYVVDILSAAGVFSILNKVWKSPPCMNVEHNPSLYYYDDSLYKNNVWIPFQGWEIQNFHLKNEYSNNSN